MTSRNIHDLCPALQVLAQDFLDACNHHPLFVAMGASVFLTCTYRSGDEQDEDYAQGRTTPGHIITNARAGQSAHNCVDAMGNPAAKGFDFAVKKSDGSVDWNAGDELWQRAISIGKSLGFISGADWHSIKDAPHMEMANWQGFGPTTGADV